VYLFAADLELERNRGPSSTAFTYIDRSLALRDNPEVSWKQAQLYMSSDVRRAELTLRRLVSSNQKAYVANHTLGMLLWELGRLTEAEAMLADAAKEQRFRGSVDDLRVWREATQELKELEASESRLLRQIEQENAVAVSEHEALYSRLRDAVCDIRQFTGWEYRSRDDLFSECQTKLITTGIEAIVTLGLLASPVGRVGRIGAAAELGAATRAARAGRMAAAETEASVASRVANVRQRGAETVREILVERKTRVVGGYNFGYWRALENEHSAALGEVNASFSIVKQEVRTRFEPLKASASEKIRQRELQRVRAVAGLHRANVRFGVKLKLSNQQLPCQWNAEWSGFYEQVRK
jgi:hypothetical protein